jgi:hypothetical protein
VTDADDPRWLLVSLLYAATQGEETDPVSLYALTPEAGPQGLVIVVQGVVETLTFLDFVKETFAVETFEGAQDVGLEEEDAGATEGE